MTCINIIIKTEHLSNKNHRKNWWTQQQRKSKSSKSTFHLHVDFSPQKSKFFFVKSENRYRLVKAFVYWNLTFSNFFVRFLPYSTMNYSFDQKVTGTKACKQNWLSSFSLPFWMFRLGVSSDTKISGARVWSKCCTNKEEKGFQIWQTSS